MKLYQSSATEVRSRRLSRIIVANILLVALLCLLFVSCFKDLECINLRNDIVQITFNKEDTGQVDALPLDTVLVTGLIAESPYAFKKGGPVNSIKFPLNPAKNQQKIEFVISEDSGLVHRELELTYDVISQFESTDCEPKFLFSNVHIDKHNFIVAKIVKPKSPSADVQVYIEAIYR